MLPFRGPRGPRGGDTLTIQRMRGLVEMSINGKLPTARCALVSRGEANSASRTLLVLIAGLMLFSGCSSFTTLHNNVRYNGAMNRFMAGYRNKAWCAKAWHKRKHGFCREKHLTEFCDGFQAGYQSVIDGGDGCTPAFPPPKYMSWKYQSAEGQNKMSSWFSGYPHGVRAAEEDGVGHWTQIQTYGGGQIPGSEANGLYPIEMPGMPGATGILPTPDVSTTDFPASSPMDASGPNLGPQTYSFRDGPSAEGLPVSKQTNTVPPTQGPVGFQFKDEVNRYQGTEATRGSGYVPIGINATQQK